MRETNGTTQHSADEQIGELFTVARAKDTMVEFATAVAKDFEVRIAFERKMGEFPKDDQAIIKSIKATANVHFEGEGVSLTASRGTDLLPLFSRHDLAAMEDRLLAGLNALEFDK